MESLIHKNSSEALDEYLVSLSKDPLDNPALTYEDVVKIIRYGLEKLIMYMQINEGGSESAHTG
jgi:hypothetical protein